MRVALGILLALVSFGPAAALDVTFSGTVTDTCSLALSTPGVMALSADGLTLGSDQTGGVPAVVTIISIGSNNITVGAPIRSAAPAGYVATGEAVEVAYNGTAGLSVVSHIYTALSSSFAVGLLPATTLSVDNQITNPNGFAQGNYQTKTVVTCS